MTTPTDVETVARALYATHDSTAHGGPPWEEIGDEPQDCYRDDARAVLAALAGRLLPEGGKPHEYWQVVYLDSTGRKYVWSTDWPIRPASCLAVARSSGWANASLETRTVTTYPDGSQLTTPWTPEGTD